MNWLPPSDSLEKSAEGIWISRSIDEISYPKDGNDACFQVEDKSYWFGHRNKSLIQVVQNYPPSGLIYDLGGGNGFVTAALEAAGRDSVLLEPGAGALNGKLRGISRIIQSTVEEASLRSGSMPAAGAFDVIEHIENDGSFLGMVNDLLEPGGRFYVTVPAYPLLWSQEDESAGHFRRYTKKSLREVMEKNGFQVEFTSYLFSWLILPVLLFRVLPSRFRGGRAKPEENTGSVNADHTLPGFLVKIVELIHRFETGRLEKQKGIPCGTSLVCVARKIGRKQQAG